MRGGRVLPPLLKSQTRTLRCNIEAGTQFALSLKGGAGAFLCTLEVMWPDGDAAAHRDLHADGGDFYVMDILRMIFRSFSPRPIKKLYMHREKGEWHCSP